MRGRLGKVLDGAGWSVGLAVALFAFALLFLALDFQSPQIVLWTGQRAVGTEQNGLVTFYNEAAVEFAGRRPEMGQMWCVTWKLFNLDGTLYALVSMP